MRAQLGRPHARPGNRHSITFKREFHQPGFAMSDDHVSNNTSTKNLITFEWYAVVIGLAERC